MSLVFDQGISTPLYTSIDTTEFLKSLSLAASWSERSKKVPSSATHSNRNIIRGVDKVLLKFTRSVVERSKIRLSYVIMVVQAKVVLYWSWTS